MIDGIKRKFKGTYTLLVINVVIFLIMTVFGGSTNTYNLIRFGAIVPSAIKSGELWRLLTSEFIHIGIAHLLMNLLFLIQVGPILESIYGTKNFLKIYLISGIMGGLFVFAFDSENTVSAGASTSLYGMLGVMIGFLIFHRDDTRLLGLGGAYVPIILINAFYTITTPGISFLGHLGGFVGGLLMTGFVPMLSKNPNSSTIKGYSSKTIFILLFIGLLIIGFIF